MRLPDGTWSQPVKYNFDTGASHPTDVAPEFLSAFGYGPDGLELNHPIEKSNQEFRIVGPNKEIDLPIMVQDKDHYDLLRDQPPTNKIPTLESQRHLNRNINGVHKRTDHTQAKGCSHTRDGGRK